ncbi:MAG: hypothetical protein ABTQ24_01435, partial [Azonexus sp.]
GLRDADATLRPVTLAAAAYAPAGGRAPASHERGKRGRKGSRLRLQPLSPKMALDCREAAAYKELKNNNERCAVMFEQTFKNIDDILHKDAGCTSELAA